MVQNTLSALDSFKNLAEELTNQRIPKEHWQKEEVILKERIEIRKKESISITMTTQKFQQAFSL